jgi:acetyl-CoA C-acetyltransferase
MKEIVITGAARTAVGGYLGTLKTLKSREMASAVILEALRRSNTEKERVDHVIMGEVLGVGNLARAATLQAGLPETVPGYTVDRQCGSSLQAIVNGAQEITAGSAEVVVAGGAEAMSSMFYIMPPSIRYQGLRLGNAQMLDIFDYSASSCVQPPELYPGLNMGITAENVAEKFSISRKEQDSFALDSQMKAAAAQNAGKFTDEIVPLEFKAGKRDVVFDQDEHPKPGTTMETLAALRPAFKKDGTVTAGNASGMNDGASAVVLMSADKAGELGARPLARIISYASAGVDPRLMGLGPVPAIQKAISLAGLSLSDIDLFEINEAFAAQSLGVLKELGMEPGSPLYGRVNVNGGAIAHGHALGNSGSRLMTTLLYEMARRGARRGVVSLCIGGGQGIAMVVENCQL